MIRVHRAIETSLHWVMDMLFRDDERRVRTDNAPENFATLKRKGPGKGLPAPQTQSRRVG
jgi:predicted transposase YbfD/YdcC